MTTVIAFPFNALLIFSSLRFLAFSNDHSELAIKLCNDWAEFMLTTFAISGNDFLLSVEIISRCQYLKHS